MDEGGGGFFTMPISSYQAANAFLKMLALAHLRRLEIKMNAWCNYIFSEWGGGWPIH